MIDKFFYLSHSIFNETVLNFYGTDLNYFELTDILMV